MTLLKADVIHVVKGRAVPPTDVGDAVVTLQKTAQQTLDTAKHLEEEQDLIYDSDASSVQFIGGADEAVEQGGDDEDDKDDKDEDHNEQEDVSDEEDEKEEDGGETGGDNDEHEDGDGSAEDDEEEDGEEEDERKRAQPSGKPRRSRLKGKRLRKSRSGARSSALPLRAWSAQRMAAWVGSFGEAYSCYRAVILKHGIDGALAQELSDPDLKELGINLGAHRKMILLQIRDAAAGGRNGHRSGALLNEPVGQSVRELASALTSVQNAVHVLLGQLQPQRQQASQRPGPGAVLPAGVGQLQVSPANNAPDVHGPSPPAPPPPPQQQQQQQQQSAAQPKKSRASGKGLSAVAAAVELQAQEGGPAFLWGGSDDESPQESNASELMAAEQALQEASDRLVEAAELASSTLLCS